MTKTFKVGDRVRTLPIGFFGRKPVGSEGVVVSINPRDTSPYPYSVRFEGDRIPWMAGAFEIDLVELKHLAPQTAKVLSILRAKGSLTAVEAAAIAKVRSLTRRITDLREAGFSVLSETRRDTEGQRYVRYYLNEAA